MIETGERAPDFHVTLTDGTPATLQDFIARGPLVLFFYPKDNTPGCTAEVCSFRDDYTSFTAIGAHVLGISSDTAASHAAFSAKHDLPFPLASDLDGAVRKAYGIPKTFGLLPGRVTFVIGTDGVVLNTFNSQFAPQKHISAALEALQSARHA